MTTKKAFIQEANDIGLHLAPYIDGDALETYLQARYDTHLSDNPRFDCYRFRQAVVKAASTTGYVV